MFYKTNFNIFSRSIDRLEDIDEKEKKNRARLYRVSWWFLTSTEFKVALLESCCYTVFLKRWSMKNLSSCSRKTQLFRTRDSAESLDGFWSPTESKVALLESCFYTVSLKIWSMKNPSSPRVLLLGFSQLRGPAKRGFSPGHEILQA